jgi:hypothetical protein
MAAETVPHRRPMQRPPAVNEAGQLDPFVLVLEGDPEQADQERGLLGRHGGG